MNKQPTVAVLGLGAMGHAFAANLLKKDLATHVWNRTQSRGEDLADAVREADVVLTMLPDGPATRTVLLGSEGAPAENAQVLVLANENRQAAAVEPVFAAIAKGTRWLGPAGAGSRMKLVVNAWLIAMM